MRLIGIFVLIYASVKVNKPCLAFCSLSHLRSMHKAYIIKTKNLLKCYSCKNSSLILVSSICIYHLPGCTPLQQQLMCKATQIGSLTSKHTSLWGYNWTLITNSQYGKNRLCIVSPYGIRNIYHGTNSPRYESSGILRCPGVFCGFQA